MNETLCQNRTGFRSIKGTRCWPRYFGSCFFRTRIAVGALNITLTWYFSTRRHQMLASGRVEFRGGFWLVDHFTGEFGGMKFEGRGFTGYDPIKGKYVGTWFDSMSPSMMVLEGSYDAAGKVLTMTGMGVGMDGKPAMHRMVTTHTGADTMEFEMFVTGEDGKEAPMMKISYTRRAEKGKGDKGTGEKGK